MNRAATAFVIAFPALVLATACDGGRPNPNGGSVPALNAGPDLSRTPGRLVDNAGGIVATVLRRLLACDDDFGRHAGDLREALGLDSNQTAAPVFLPIVEFLQTARRLLMDADPARGKLRDLLDRAGIRNASVSGNFWDFAPEEQVHGQGDIKDSTPSLDVWQAFLANDVRPALVKLRNALTVVPPAFVYRVPAESRGKLGSLFADTLDVEIDYGDIVMLRGATLAAIAQIDILSAYDNAKLAPNDFDEIDFPNVDPLALIEDKYKTFGTLLPASGMLLLSARQLLSDAFQDYTRAALHIRNEPIERQAIGLLTVGKRTFATDAERKLFLDREDAARAWTQSIVVASFANSAFTVTKRFDGVDIPVNERPTIRFFQPWTKGLDIRSIFLRTIVHPLDGQRVLGVADLAQLTPKMYTFDGMIEKWNGIAPGPGDLQESRDGIHYARRVDPPTSTKTIDGDSSDWNIGVDAVQLAFTPVARQLPPHPDLGNVLAAQDAGNLYLLIDRDLRTYVKTSADRFSVRIQGRSGFASLNFGTEWKVGAGGIEIRVPKVSFPADKWVEVVVRVFAENASYRIDSTRAGLFVTMR